MHDGCDDEHVNSNNDANNDTIAEGKEMTKTRKGLVASLVTAR
jgi:hypothetical protein